MYVRVHFLALYSISLVFMSGLMPVSYCFGYCNFVVSFESRKGESPTLSSLSLQDCFGYLAASGSFQSGTSACD